MNGSRTWHVLNPAGRVIFTGSCNECREFIRRQSYSQHYKIKPALQTK